MTASRRLAIAALLVACACGSPEQDRERFVVRATWLSSCPTGAQVCLDGSGQFNELVAEVELGEAIEVEPAAEYWLRVRKANGKTGYLRTAFASPAGTAPAVAIERAECYPGRFLGGAVEKALEPGKVVFAERRRFGRWRLPLEPECPWVKRDALSEETPDLELAFLLARIPDAKPAAKDELLAQARLLAPRTQLASLVETVEATIPRPLDWSPRPLEPGEVPASKAPADACGERQAGLPVPEDYGAPYVGDPAAFSIVPIRTNGAYAAVAPRFALDWQPAVRRACAWIDLDRPVAAGTAARTETVCNFDAPEAELGGSWYLAMPGGVFAAKVAGVGGRVRLPLTGTDDFRADLLLRPAPGGGTGFAVWSPGSRTFRACPIPVVAADAKGYGLRADAQDGKLAVVEGEPPAARRAVVDHPATRIASAYRLEMLPGGTFLFLALGERAGPERGWCQQALLLRWSDLGEVARIDCSAPR